MLSALAERPELAGLTPFAALFYGTPSTYVFYDEEGRAHDVQQGEGRRTDAIVVRSGPAPSPG